MALPKFLLPRHQCFAGSTSLNKSTALSSK
jgi:hypothetical protein